MAEQATIIRFREQGKDKLGFWLSDKLDELMFLTAAGRAYSLTTTSAARASSQLPSLRFAADVAAATTNRIIYAGSATSEATITASDKMSWATLVRANSFAQEKRLRPIRSGGKGHYVVVMHPRQARDLRLDPTYQTITKSAAVNGEKNPLFTGAHAVVDSLVIHVHNKVYNTSGNATKWGSGSLVDGAQAQVLGAQALGIATLGSMFWRESGQTDFGNRPGIGVGRKVGMLKPQFKSVHDSNSREDFGMITLKTAAAA